MKTNIQEIIRNAEIHLKNNSNLVFSSDVEGITQELGIPLFNYWDNEERLKGVRSKVWCCTDTWVGFNVYFLDEEPVFIGYKTSRKGNENFSFISELAKEKTKNYLFSLMTDEEYYNGSVLTEEELNGELDLFYSVEYSGNILHKYGFYFNDDLKKYEVIEILKTADYYRKDVELPDAFHSVKIKFIDRNVTTVVMSNDIFFKYNQGLKEIPSL